MVRRRVAVPDRRAVCGSGGVGPNSSARCRAAGAADKPWCMEAGFRSPMIFTCYEV